VINENYATTKAKTVEKEIVKGNKVHQRGKPVFPHFNPLSPYWPLIYACVSYAAILGKDASLTVVDAKVVLTHVDTVWKMGKMARNQANTFEVADFFDPWAAILRWMRKVWLICLDVDERLRQILGLENRMMEDLDLDEEDDLAVRRGGRLGDWAKIGWMAMQNSRRAPGMEFM
jgi:hypothetical protein